MKTIYTDLLDKFNSFLKGLSPEDLSDLELRKAALQIRITSLEKTINHVKELQSSKPLDIDQIINELSKLKSRSEGEIFLNSHHLSKLDLHEVIKKLDLPFSKKDGIQRLKDKIIERTIGFRLRSEAIHG